MQKTEAHEAKGQNEATRKRGSPAFTQAEQAQSAPVSEQAGASPGQSLQRRIAAMVDDSPRQVAQRASIERIHQSPHMLAQLHSADTVRRRAGGVGREAPATMSRANDTGLPDPLKSGIEQLSGMSMDHVKVHYNSSQPAQLSALAYARGSDIHLGPGQERHLPHEAWHVVQQAQGRVRPTTQMKGIGVNDDAALEREADAMGAKAMRGASGAAAVRPVAPAASGVAGQLVACSGAYLAGIFDKDSVMDLRRAIGEEAFRYFMTLDTHVFAPLVGAFIGQAPIPHPVQQVAFLQPYAADPVQLSLASQALRQAAFDPARARYLYPYMARGSRVVAVALAVLGDKGNDIAAATQAMQELAPYDYHASVMVGADAMAATIAGAEIDDERATAVSEGTNFQSNYEQQFGMKMDKGIDRNTAGTPKTRNAFAAVFPDVDIEGKKGGDLRDAMNGARTAKITEIDEAPGKIDAKLPQRTQEKSQEIRQALARLYPLPDAEANANWCMAQAGQDMTLLHCCVDIVVAVGGHVPLRDRFSPLPHAGRHALLYRLSVTLGGQLNPSAIAGLLDLLEPLDIAAVQALVNLLHGQLDSAGIDNLILNLHPANGTEINFFLRAHVPALTGAQLAQLVHRMRPLPLDDISQYLNLLNGLDLKQVHALTVAMNPADAAIGTQIRDLASTLCAIIPNPLPADQFRTLVLGLDGLPGDRIEAMVTRFIVLGMNDGQQIRTRIETMRGSLVVGGNQGASVTSPGGERIRSGEQIAEHVGLVGAQAEMLLYPRSGIDPAGRAENDLWNDCNANILLDPMETASEVAMRQQMALHAIVSLGGVQRRIAQRVFAEQDGRRPRAMGDGAAEDALSALAGNAGHITSRHVLGGGGIINTLVHLQARADGNPAYPPCPQVAGAFASAAASQVGMHAAIQATNWPAMRRDIIRGLPHNVQQPFAGNGHVARLGQPMHNAPPRVYVQVTGGDVNGGFYCFHSFPRL